MDCRDCQAHICDLSADALPAAAAESVREHLTVCATCGQEMAVLERTLFSVSCLSQPLPSPLASEQMWHRCAEHIFQKVEAQRSGAQNSTAAVSAPAPEYSRGALGWFSRQPRWSWGALGGALAVLAGVWFLAPQDNSITFANNGNFPTQNDSPGELVALRTPPGMAAGLIDHHSAMTVDPFTDYVGTTLVSYSATSPQTASSTRATISGR